MMRVPTQFRATFISSTCESIKTWQKLTHAQIDAFQRDGSLPIDVFSEVEALRSHGT